MAQHYHRTVFNPNRRKSTSGPLFTVEQTTSEQLNLNRRSSVSHTFARRFSTIELPYEYESEYHPQKHFPPTGIENPQPILLQHQHDDDQQTRGSSISEQENHENKLKQRILFVIEPILSGLILFPILVLFWECGWNLVLIMLNVLNGFSSELHLTEIDLDDFESYTWQSLLIPYVIQQILLLLLYLCQDFIYNFLHGQTWLIQMILLKCHILLLAFLYIVQWEMLWTIWDQFTPPIWYFELTLSIASLFALIVFIGHLSDLVCSPFIFSYDSIEYCIHFGCPLLTKDMPSWKINLINFLLYEVIISNLSILIWHGLYNILDDYLYPDNVNKSAGICLIAGYALYFPLMYFQSYFEELNLKFSFWTFISINFPQFYRNIRHLLSFVSCLFVWRGWWMLFDEYIYIYDEYWINYLLCFVVSYFFLSLIQTASSTNGPLSNMEDRNGFFPLYPHSYISTVEMKLSEMIFKEPTPTNTKNV